MLYFFIFPSGFASSFFFLEKSKKNKEKQNKKKTFEQG